MSGNSRGVNAESRQRLGPLFTHIEHRERGNQEALSTEQALGEGNDQIATQLGATNEMIDVCVRSACGHWQRV